MITRPMLAGSPENLDKIRFPVLASMKLDGIRCLKVDGKALTRKFKDLPNRYVRAWLEANLPDGIDGELLTFHEDGKQKTFNEIQSDIMSFEGEPNFKFLAFDIVTESLTSQFQHRYIELVETIKGLTEANDDIKKRLVVVEHKLILDMNELLEFEKWALSQEQEGVMVRSLEGPYKCNRSTEKEGYLLKIKRRVADGVMVEKLDSEAEIVGFEELMHNSNEKEVNELGLSKRSSKKAGMVPAGMLGKFLVKDIHTGIPFSIGTGDGLTQKMRKEIWDNQANYLGKIVKYEYEPHGVKDKPRFPVWIGFRDERDIS